ncbi:hypothetical protein J6590_099625 [Homalodisca vitripennis]|nr:hypothetical protein J6590_099625 [Homalodisca vitripennis]
MNDADSVRSLCCTTAKTLIGTELSDVSNLLNEPQYVLMFTGPRPIIIEMDSQEQHELEAVNEVPRGLGMREVDLS